MRPYDAQAWEAPEESEAEESEAEELLSFAEHEARNAIGEPSYE